MSADGWNPERSRVGNIALVPGVDEISEDQIKELEGAFRGSPAGMAAEVPSKDSKRAHQKSSATLKEQHAREKAREQEKKHAKRHDEEHHGLLEKLEHIVHHKS